MPSEPRLLAADAAKLAGVSYVRMLAFLRCGEIVGEQLGRTWYVDPVALEQWVARQRLVAGTLGPSTSGPPRRTNVQLLDDVMALPGWDLERLAVQLKTSIEKIEGWYQTGVPNYYVPRLRKVPEG